MLQSLNQTASTWSQDEVNVPKQKAGIRRGWSNISFWTFWATTNIYKLPCHVVILICYCNVTHWKAKQSTLLVPCHHRVLLLENPILQVLQEVQFLPSYFSWRLGTESTEKDLTLASGIRTEYALLCNMQSAKRPIKKRTWMSCVQHSLLKSGIIYNHYTNKKLTSCDTQREQPASKGLDFFGEFFLFSGLASFSLRFPLVFLHFPYLSFVFHRFSLFFIGFPLVLLQFPHFSVVFHRFSSVFLGFPWFSLFFHCFACISSLFHCFASFRYVFIGLIAFSSFLCVFLLQFSFMFSCFLCFPLFFWFYTAFSSLFCCFYLGCVSLVFLFHWFSYIFLYIMVFSCIGFCSLSSLFSVATYVVGACCCCCWWWWWWLLLLFWCFHVFSVGWRLKAIVTMLVNDAAVLLSLHEVAAGGQP